MAIYHYSAKIISRSSGRSSVAAAAYRSGEKICNERDGITHDYTNKTGIVHSEILLPEYAPQNFSNRSVLWNEVERVERRKDAQTAREIDVALPIEFNLEEQKNLLRDFVNENFVQRGMIADICIHDKKDGNPHAHIMLTTRTVTPDGFGKKEREWNNKELLNDCREQWAIICNREFEKKNLPERIDHRTLEAQGIEREPTVHMGAAAHQMEQKGIETDRGNINREVKAGDMEYKQGLEELERELQQLRQAMPQPEPASLEQNESLLHGAVKNPDRNDEQETRKWQVGDGLERVEPAQAKETALTESQEVREQPVHVSATPIAGKSAEQIADRLNGLKSEYIRMELTITRQQAAASNLNQEYRQVQSSIEDLKGRTETVKQYSQKIEQLQDRRSSLGVFSGKEKKEIDNQVKRLEQSKDQAIQSLVHDYGIQPQAAQEKIKELELNAARLQEQRSNLPDINAIRAQQKNIGEEYQKEKTAAAQHPETDKIKQLTQEQKRPDNQSMTDRMAAAKAESRLDSSQHEPSRTAERGR